MTDNKQIQSIADIVSLSKSGFEDWNAFGNVKVSTRDDLRLFNYTAKAQFEGSWNYFERVSRGLIINAKTGEVIARPFDKFFNYGEGKPPSSKIKNVMQKMDGSLGISYYDNGFKIATRGSFDSEQAIWATDYLHTYHDISAIHGVNQFTFLFEIIYPSNRIVIDYGGACDLVLLAARNRFNGEYLTLDGLKGIASKFQFSIPKVYQFDNIDSILESAKDLDLKEEGWVIEFESGERCKVKGDAYKFLHRAISYLSFKNTLEAVKSNSVNKLIEIVPDEFLGDVKKWLNEIENTRYNLSQRIIGAFGDAPKKDRKTFALWVMGNYKELAPYLFASLDGRDIDQMIYKNAFSERQSDSTSEVTNDD